MNETALYIYTIWCRSVHSADPYLRYSCIIHNNCITHVTWHSHDYILYRFFLYTCVPPIHLLPRDWYAAWHKHLNSLVSTQLVATTATNQKESNLHLLDPGLTSKACTSLGMIRPSHKHGSGALKRRVLEPPVQQALKVRMGGMVGSEPSDRKGSKRWCKSLTPKSFSWIWRVPLGSYWGTR